jgi:hypothetical protein
MTPNLGFPAIAAVGDSAAWKLGDIIRAVDPVYGVGEFIYLKGVGSTVRGSAVTYNADDFTSTLLAANAIGPVAVAMAATVANKYGWYQISGKAIVKAGTVVDDANVYATASGGVVDDAVVAGDRVKNAKFASADGTPSAGLAEVEISRPWMDDAVAA